MTLLKKPPARTVWRSLFGHTTHNHPRTWWGFERGTNNCNEAAADEEGDRPTLWQLNHWMVLECRRILIKFGIWFVLEFLRFTVNYQNWQSVWILKPNKLPRTRTTRNKYQNSRAARKSTARDNNEPEKENQWLIYWGKADKRTVDCTSPGSPSKHGNGPNHDVIARGQIPPN